MASITVNFVRTEPVGGHAHVGLRVNGGEQYVVPTHIDEIRSVPTTEEIEAFVKCFIRLHAIGKTAGQIRNNLTTGLAVTI